MAFDLEDLRIISRTTSALISSIGSRELFQTIVDGGRDITGAKFVSLSFFDEDEGTVELGALSGLEHPLLKRVSEILGVEDLLRYEFQVEGCASFEKFLGEKERRPYVLSGLHEFTFESLDGRACSLVEKIVGIEEVTVIPLLREGKLEGIMGYMFPSKEDRDFTPLLIFADLASQAIERSKMFRRMREEKERAKSYSEELRKSKERFRRLFEGSPDITLVINEEGIIEEINEVACRKTGLSEEEIVGRSYEDFSLLAESSRGRLVKNFERRMAGEEVPHIPWNLGIGRVRFGTPKLIPLYWRKTAKSKGKSWSPGTSRSAGGRRRCTGRSSTGPTMRCGSSTSRTVTSSRTRT